MNKVILAGGSGLIGKALAVQFVDAGYEVVILTRSAPQATRPSGDRLAMLVAEGRVRYAVWDARTTGDWSAELEGAAGVVNLTGETIAQSWTTEVKARLMASRVESTAAIGEAIRACATPPKSWVNVSGIGIYGDRGDELIPDPDMPLGAKGDFIVDMAVAWEAEADRWQREGVALAKLRIGVVLTSDGGYLKPLAMAARWFLGGHFGSGSQYVSWIALEDLCNLTLWLVKEGKSGTYHGVSPTPVTNAFFMATLRAVLGRPWAPPVPAFVLGIASLFGAPPASLVLTGQRAVPARAEAEGFRFQHGSLHEVLAQALGVPKGLPAPKR